MLSRMRSTAPEPSDQPPLPRCALCKDVLGVYEPIVGIVDGRPLVTSRAALGPEAVATGGPFWHRDCWSIRNAL